MELGGTVLDRPVMSDGKCTRAFFAGRISSTGQIVLSCFERLGFAQGIPGGHAGSQAGCAGTCRDETMTRLASAWRTSLTNRPVTEMGRGN